MSINFLKENIMKNAFTTTAVILAATLSAGSSFAAYSAPQNQLNNVATSSYFAQSAPSVLSRDAVKGEFLNAQQARVGVNTKETSSHFAQSAPSVLSRDAVKADLQQARRSGNASAVDYRG